APPLASKESPRGRPGAGGTAGASAPNPQLKGAGIMARARQPGGAGQGGQSPRLAASAWDQSAAESAMKMMVALQQQLTQQAQAREKAQTRVGLAYAVTTASMLGWVRAGIQATTIGERLSWQQRMLSQQIASLFVPWIEKAIDALSRLTEWF